MHVLRRASIGLLSFFCIISVSLIIYLATLQATIFDRSVVKSWLVGSGVYHNNLVPTLLQTGAANSETADPTTTNGQFQIPASAIKTALERTFTGDYVRIQAEATIDKFYDWLEGKSPQFSFTIPIDQKRDTFIAELSQVAEPSIAALPVCSTVQLGTTTQCRPANIAPDLYTQRIIADNVNQSGFFKQPIGIKNDTPSASANSLIPQLSTELQLIVPLIGSIMIGLAGLGIISVALILWLSVQGQRLATTAQLARRIFFAQIFTFLAAQFFWWSFQTGFFKFTSLLPNQPIVISQTLSAIVKLAVTDVSSKLALLSGIVCILSLSVWLGVHILQRRATQVTVVPPVSSDSETSQTN